QFERLAGVSVSAAVSCRDQNFNESILFTHRGLSGPAALQISSYWQPGDELSIDLLPGQSIDELVQNARAHMPARQLSTTLNSALPKALVTELGSTQWSRLPTRRHAELSTSDIEALDQAIHHWRIKPAATEGYRTAEVTLGGVDTDALSSKTMESRSQPGLFFIGEVVDVTGHLGGFNFQWAWASAVAAAEAL
ncbi:MAG: NAD(P)/FAD-dependent oxidoreductase, partial [Pseudomonadota bacterium]